MSQAFNFVETTVKRMGAGQFELGWPPDRNPAPSAIYVRERSKQWRQAAGPDQITGEGVTIGGLEPSGQQVFKLVARDGSCVIVAERRIIMDGAVNFRDIGGYRTMDDRIVRWGRVYRSDGLSRLKDTDLQVLGQLGVRHVFDFRTRAEVWAAPNRLPKTPPVIYLNLPVTHGEFDFVEALKRIKHGDASWLTPDFMVKGYLSSLSSYGETWGRVIRHLAGEPDGATVFHCTGGKDRTGTCAAIILLALGVPEEKVIEDHQLSNIYITELLPKISDMIAAFGVNLDSILPYLTAPRECIVSLIKTLNAEYGSAPAYLKQKAGVDEKTLNWLKGNLLDPECP